MDMEELARELEMLKSESAAAKEEKRMGGFIDKYGTKFNNNTDIANLILAEMDRQGVPEASEAASEAVQAVLDKLREEATVILDETKGAMKQISDLMDKIGDIEGAVNSATNGQTGPGAVPPVPPPEAGLGGAEPPPIDAGAIPPPDAAGGEIASPEAGGAPPPVDAAGGELPPEPVPGAEAGGGEPPLPFPGGSELPPEPEMGEAPPLPEEEEIPMAAATGGFIPSDERLKNIRSKFNAFAASRKASAPTVPSDKNIKKVWKPSAGILEGVRGLI
jgi:hypothetical protein